MANPLVALGIEHPDIGGAYIEGQKAAETRRTSRLSNMINEFKLQEAQQSAEKQTRLEQLYKSQGPGIASGDPTAIAALAQTDPEAAQKARSGAITQQSAALKQQHDLAEHLYEKASYIDKLPESMKAVAYENEFATLKRGGIDPTSLGLKPTWDQDTSAMVHKVASDPDAVLSAKDRLTAKHNEATIAETQRQRTETERHNKADEGLRANQIAATNRRTDIMSGKQTYGPQQTIEVDDGKGGRTRMTAQQEKNSLQWVSADESKAPIDVAGKNISVLPANLGGGRVAGQTGRITAAGELVTSALKNMAELPSTANLGALHDASQHGTIMGALARSVTPNDAVMYQKISAGLNRGVAALESAGLAPNGDLVKQIGALDIQPGQSGESASLSLAEYRQAAESTLRAIMKGPLLTPQQQTEVGGMLDDLKKAIPWTPHDVIQLHNSTNKRQTLLDMAKQQGLGQGLKVGDVEDGYRFKGGDKSKPESWEKVQ